MKHLILAAIILTGVVSAQAMQSVPASCPPEKPLLSEDGNCYTCDDPRDIEIAHLADCSNLCQKEDGSYLRKSKGSSCELIECPAGMVRSKDVFKPGCVTPAPCPPEKPLLSKNGECFACDTPLAVKLQNDSDCSANCSVNGKSLRTAEIWGCTLNQCPEGLNKNPFGNCLAEPTICPASHPLREGKNCYACDYEKTVDMSPDDIEKCLTACVDENNQPTRKIYRNAGCGVISCPPEKPLLAHGQCYSCDETEALATKDCNICSEQRHTITLEGDPYCALKACPQEKALRTVNGTCISCDDPYAVSVEKGTCQQTCPNRTAEESYYDMDIERCTYEDKNDNRRGVIITESSETKAPATPLQDCTTEKPLQDYQGGCYACDNPSDIYTNNAECAKCPNRQVTGRWSSASSQGSYKGVTCSLK